MAVSGYLRRRKGLAERGKRRRWRADDEIRGRGLAMRGAQHHAWATASLCFLVLTVVLSLNAAYMTCRLLYSKNEYKPRWDPVFYYWAIIVLGLLPLSICELLSR